MLGRSWARALAVSNACSDFACFDWLGSRAPRAEDRGELWRAPASSDELPESPGESLASPGEPRRGAGDLRGALESSG
eukprot:4043595-Alexandrium_andersonii.AAC.1